MCANGVDGQRTGCFVDVGDVHEHEVGDGLVGASDRSMVLTDVVDLGQHALEAQPRLPPAVHLHEEADRRTDAQTGAGEEEEKTAEEGQ